MIYTLGKCSSIFRRNKSVFDKSGDKIMAMLGFLKKKKAAPAPGQGPMPAPPMPPSGVPTEQVVTMRQQGLANNQIISTLQRQGFTSAQIFDAMSQADIKSGVSAAPPAAAEPAPPVAPPTVEPRMEAPLAGHTGAPPPPPPPAPQGGQPSESFEEIAESIVEEKWKDISEEFDKLKAWKEGVDEKLNKFDQAIKDIQADMQNLHKAIVSKISEYDKNLLSVGTEIKAMEKVFSKVLPTFTQNVSELSRAVRTVKKKIPAKK